MHSSMLASSDLVLVGGGHSHALFLKMWGMRPLAGVRVTLISNTSHTPYSGMLPGFIGGQYSFEETHIDLRKLATFAQVCFIQAEVIGLDLQAKKVLCKDRPPVRFDLLSLNCGSFPYLKNLQGADIVPVKPVPTFLKKWKEVLQAKGKKTISIIGAGAGGVELALWMHSRLKGQVDISLFQKASTIMPTHNKAVRKKLTKILYKRGIRVHLDTDIVSYQKNILQDARGENFKSDHVFALTHADAFSWVKSSGLNLDSQGFVEINTFLQSTSHNFVFACGDMASMQNYSRPKTGVFAVRQARPLYENLKRTLLKQNLKTYRPQANYLNLIGTADGKAIASRRFMAVYGKACWWLKDWIDRRFMSSLQDLPVMQEKLISSHITEKRMSCHGCGAKVPGKSLKNVFERLKKEEKTVQIPGVKSDWRTLEDAAVIRPTSDTNWISSLDYFPALIQDPYLLGRLGALHAFSDIFAMGGKAHSALLQVQLPFMQTSLQEESLYQILKGVLFELDKMPAALLGGHTTQGELGIGLQVNGTVNETLLKKQGLKVGDQLILTKALGTGVLFAGKMQLKSKGFWIDEAIESMLTSNQKAAELAHSYEVHAMTDVTGFGLMGHLQEMLGPSSNMKAELFYEGLPALKGALELIGEGIKSTLFADNIELDPSLNSQKLGAYQQLAFDPQTSGGLLMAVSKPNMLNLLEDLRQNGYERAACIGEVQEC